MFHYVVHNHTCLILPLKHNTLLSFLDMSTRAILSSMPCSLCSSWDENPSWHRCDAACVNTQGTAKLHSGEEIRCSRSWDGTWWFFFCNQCKKNRPHIIGVFRKVRIWHSPYLGQIDYTTDSENASYSYSSSEGESCTQEEAEYFFSIQETARAGSLSTLALPQPSQLKEKSSLQCERQNGME